MYTDVFRQHQGGGQPAAAALGGAPPEVAMSRQVEQQMLHRDPRNAALHASLHAAMGADADDDMMMGLRTGAPSAGGLLRREFDAPPPPPPPRDERSPDANRRPRAAGRAARPVTVPIRRAVTPTASSRTGGPDSFGRVPYVVPRQAPASPAASAKRGIAAAAAKRRAATPTRAAQRRNGGGDGYGGAAAVLPALRPQLDAATYGLQRHLHGVSGRLKELNGQLAGLTATHAALQGEGAALRREVQDAERERDETQQQFAALCGSLRASMAEIQGGLEQTARELADARAENARLKGGARYHQQMRGAF
jgi:hypothetical protein